MLEMVELWIYPLMVIATLLGALGSLFLKLGSKHLSRNLKHLLFNKILILGLSLFVLSTILVIIALKFSNLSKIFPMTALTYIWVAILSQRILKEKITREKLAAFILIIIGIIFVTN